LIRSAKWDAYGTFGGSDRSDESIPELSLSGPKWADLLLAFIHGSAEDIAVAVLAEPTTLAGGLAGLATVRLGAVTLAIRGARIREEELAATEALATAWRTAH
jgi:hypothetical protein